ncbi:hypothetical protein DJ013_04530 [Arcticibacterium luteifluviistationis]|uniref:Uncharacterized protein n=1 Tax=Arcticibacterium luteifluviistationis TaxID=1784714 RepID=A0A2Z4G8J8_9BACT|nr:hypothetical protein DJ013_04530 [Arcticibacterium luteifluviistationis]
MEKIFIITVDGLNTKHNKSNLKNASVSQPFQTPSLVDVNSSQIGTYNSSLKDFKNTKNTSIPVTQKKLFFKYFHEVIIAVIVGLIILLIEYKTGLFSNK